MNAFTIATARVGGLTTLLFAATGGLAFAQTSQSLGFLSVPTRISRPTHQIKGTQMLVYIGSYTKENSKGITLFTMNTETGELTLKGTAPAVSNPSFLAIHPSHKFLYAVNEDAEFEGKKGGAVSAFSIAPKTGELTLLNQKSAIGEGPCHLSIDHTGKWVLTASYGNGVFSVLPIKADGKLGDSTCSIQNTGTSVNAQREEAAHAHSLNVDAGNHFAIGADLGLDKLFIYRLDTQKGKIVPNTTPSISLAKGSGPRHFAFHPDGHHAYVINELNSTVTALEYDSKAGTLKDFQTLSSLPEGFTGENSTAEVQVHPSGKFLYGSNRGHDSIVIYAIEAGTGKLTLIGHESTQGKTPRNFGIDPTGTFLIAANQGSDSIVVFRIDPQTGTLKPTGQKLDVSMPVCVKFLSLAH